MRERSLLLEGIISLEKMKGEEIGRREVGKGQDNIIVIIETTVEQGMSKIKDTYLICTQCTTIK